MIIYLDKNLTIEKVVHRDPFYAGSANTSKITVITKKKDASYITNILFKRSDGAIVGPYTLNAISNGYEIILQEDPLKVPGELKFTIRFEKYALVDGYPQLSESIPVINLSVNVNYAVVIGGNNEVDLRYRIYQAFQMIQELRETAKNDIYIGEIEPNHEDYNKWINTDGHSEEETNIVIDEPIASTYNLRPATIETTETIVIDEETEEAITVYEASEGISVIEINENASETIYINNSSDKEIIIIEE